MPSRLCMNRMHRTHTCSFSHTSHRYACCTFQLISSTWATIHFNRSEFNGKTGKLFPKNIIRLLNFTSKIFTWSLSCVLMFEKWTAIELDDARTTAMLWLHPNRAMCVCLSFCRKSKYLESFFVLFDLDAVCCPWCRSGMSWGYSELSPNDFSEAYPAFLKRFGWTIKTKTPSWNPLESNQFSGSYPSNLKGRTVSKFSSIISQ